MKKLLLFLAVLFTGGLALFALGLLVFIAAIRRIPSDWRDRVTRLPGALMGRMMERMPDGCPCEEIVSGVSRIQEQNEELLTLVRERLPAQGPRFPEPTSTGSSPE